MPKKKSERFIDPCRSSVRNSTSVAPHPQCSPDGSDRKSPNHSVDGRQNGQRSSPRVVDPKSKSLHSMEASHRIAGRHVSPSDRSMAPSLVVDRRSFTPNISRPPPLDDVLGIKKDRVHCSIVFGSQRPHATALPGRSTPTRLSRCNSASSATESPRPVVFLNVPEFLGLQYEKYSSFRIREPGRQSPWTKTLHQPGKDDAPVVKVLKKVARGAEAILSQQEACARLAIPKPLYISREEDIME